jgi:carboxyl-terminal processing protease
MKIDTNNQPLRILFMALVLAFVFLIGHVSAILIYGEDSEIATNSRQAINNFLGEDDLQPEDLEVFWEVYRELDENYIDSELPNDRELVEGATEGMVSSLDDRYTNYYTAQEWEEIQNSNSGRFQGIGIKLQQGEEYPIIESPIKGSPAAEAGLLPRDLITAVDGESVRGMSLTAVAEQIRGEKGTVVTLEIFRPESGETLDVEVERSDIDVDSVEVGALEDGGYMISLSRFTESTYGEFTDQWDSAVDQVEANDAEYLVLDLRNNSGGWVDAAKYVLGEFLPEGTEIFSEIDRNDREVVTVTDREGKLVDIPMVVIVNGGSASASEIVAGALQDQDRAQLVGEPTLGKGVEQRIISLSDGGSLHVVFKKWLTPDGKNLSEDEALTPDVEVELDSEDIQNNRDPQLEAAKNVLK